MKSQRTYNCQAQPLAEKGERMENNETKESDEQLPVGSGAVGYVATHNNKKPNRYFGKDCPKGKVQIEFVGCSPKAKINDYGWKPVDSAFIEIYVDGTRFRVQVGDIDDGMNKRRGLHIVGPYNLQLDKTARNSCSLFLGEAT